MATLEEEAQKLLNEDEFNAVFRHIKTVVIWNRPFLIKPETLRLFYQKRLLFRRAFDQRCLLSNDVFRHFKTVVIWNTSFLLKNLKAFDSFIINDCSLVIIYWLTTSLDISNSDMKWAFLKKRDLWHFFLSLFHFLLSRMTLSFGTRKCCKIGYSWRVTIAVFPPRWLCSIRELKIV